LCPADAVWRVCDEHVGVCPPFADFEAVAVVEGHKVIFLIWLHLVSLHKETRLFRPGRVGCAFYALPWVSWSSATRCSIAFFCIGSPCCHSSRSSSTVVASAICSSLIDGAAVGSGSTLYGARLPRLAVIDRVSGLSMCDRCEMRIPPTCSLPNLTVGSR